MTELHAIDADAGVVERIRRRAHRTLLEEADNGFLPHLERTLAQWIEPPLVATFATGLVLWALRVTF